MNIFCKICNSQTVYGIETFAKYHLKKVHNLTSKEYYDQTKQSNEGICKVCGNPTKFRNINEGYNVFCSNTCAVSDPEQLKLNIAESQKAQRRLYDGKLFFETKTGQKRVQKTVKEKYGAKSCFMNRDIQAKLKQSCIEKYGVDNPFKSKELQLKASKNKIQKYGSMEPILERCRQTWIKKYGVDNFNKTRKFRRHMEEIGKWTPIKNLNKYEKYRRAVNKETRKYRKKVLENCKGICYYTSKKLIFNEEWYKLNPNVSVSRNPLQPTIDHKIPIVYGFKNIIPAEQIGGLDNLCVCARYVNTKKNHRTEYKGE